MQISDNGKNNIIYLISLFLIITMTMLQPPQVLLFFAGITCIFIFEIILRLQATAEDELTIDYIGFLIAIFLSTIMYFVDVGESVTMFLNGVILVLILKLVFSSTQNA